MKKCWKNRKTKVTRNIVGLIYLQELVRVLSVVVNHIFQGKYQSSVDIRYIRLSIKFIELDRYPLQILQKISYKSQVIPNYIIK